MSQLNLPHGKQKKLKSKNRYARSNSKSLGSHVVSPGEEKERLQWEGFAEKGGFKSGKKERVGDEKLIVISVSCHQHLAAAAAAAADSVVASLLSMQ